MPVGNGPAKSMNILKVFLNPKNSFDIGAPTE